MTDRVILNLSPGWFILADSQQWTLAKAEKKTDAARFKKRQARFKAIGHIGGQKATLERLTKENGVPVTAQAQRVMDTWPETFLEWQRQQDRRAAA